MTLLILGILLFACVHFVPSLLPGLKTGWQAKMGEGGYKGIFSLLLLASFALMIFGWRSSDAAFIYQPIASLRTFALVLMAVAFVLLTVSSRPSRIRQFVRHPQLAGTAIWGVSHLLLNGDSRSLVLFGGLTAWAVIEILAISRREGAWVKGDIPTLGTEVVTLVITAASITFFVFVHPWISGASVSW